MNIKELAEKHRDYIIDRRRYYHAHPEPSMFEFETTNALVKDLEAMGLEVHRFEKVPGCWAMIKGGKEGQTVMLRSDIDALPVKEQTGLPFASENEGFMHACGHDNHMSTQLGAAKILLDMKEELCGNVKIVFQPSEETGKGAQHIIAEGVMEGVDGVFGMHVWSSLDSPKYNFESGPRMAAVDKFDVKIHGYSSHGSAPHLGCDAIMAAANFIMTIQSIVSRRNNPLNPLVVTIGEFKGGQRFNIIANEVTMSATVRSFENDTRMIVEPLAREILNNSAASYGCTAELEYEYILPSVDNADKRCVDLARNAVIELYGEDHLGEFPKVTGGEDFCFYQQKVPGVFGFVGTRHPDIPGSEMSNHHECFTTDEEQLIRSAAITAKFAMDFLSK